MDLANRPLIAVKRVTTAISRKTGARANWIEVVTSLLGIAIALVLASCYSASNFLSTKRAFFRSVTRMISRPFFAEGIEAR